MKKLLFVVLLLLSLKANAAISFDGSSSGGSLSPASSTTFVHTVGSGSHRVLLVQVFTSNSQAVTSMTYNGATMLLATQNLGGSRAGIETYFIMDPDVGSHNVVVNLSGSTTTYLICLSVSYFGVGQLNGLSQSAYVAPGDDSQVSVNVTTHENDSWVVTAVSNSTDNTTGFPTSSVNRVGLSAAGVGFDQRDTAVASPSVYTATYSEIDGTTPEWIESGIEMEEAPPDTFTTTPTSSVTPSATPTWTITPTSTASPTRTATPSNTATPSVTLTATPTFTATPSITPTWSITQTWSASPTFTNTRTNTPTSTISPTRTITPTHTITPICNPGNGGVYSWSAYPAANTLLMNSFTEPGITNLHTINAYFLPTNGGKAAAALYTGGVSSPVLISATAFQSVSPGWNAFPLSVSNLAAGTYMMAIYGSAQTRLSTRAIGVDYESRAKTPGVMPPRVTVTPVALTFSIYGSLCP